MSSRAGPLGSRYSHITTFGTTQVQYFYFYKTCAIAQLIHESKMTEKYEDTNQRIQLRIINIKILR